MTDPSLCTEIQLLISAAYDGDAPDAQALDSAKTHCSTCPSCAGFVGLLAEIRRLPAPEVPADVLERTLAAVRAEADSTAIAAATPAPDATPPGETAAAPPAPGALDTPAAPSRTAGSMRAWAPWAAAAAVFFLVAGVVATQGVRYLMSPGTAGDSSSASDSIALQSTEDYSISGGPGAGLGAETERAAPGMDAETGAMDVAGPAFVTFMDRVYAYDSTLDGPPSGAPTGLLVSALDSPTPAQSREVYAESGTTAIVVVGDEGAHLRFVPVTRSFGGRPYALRSPMISAFGVWPSMPPHIPQPSRPDGTPEFIPAGTDDAGVGILSRAGSDPSAGFAIAPSTATAGSAGQIPEWTWWEPDR